MIMILLLLVWLEVINQHQFILYLTASYFLRMFVMQFYAFKLYMPKFSFHFPENMKEVINYSGFIILAGSAGAILLDIDKVMLPAKEALEYSSLLFCGCIYCICYRGTWKSYASDCISVNLQSY